MPASSVPGPSTRLMATSAFWNAICPAMTKWVEYLRLHSDGLIRDQDRGNDYGDWLSIGANTPKDLIGTAYLCLFHAPGGAVLPGPRTHGGGRQIRAIVSRHQDGLQPALCRRGWPHQGEYPVRLCHGPQIRAAAGRPPAQSRAVSGGRHQGQGRASFHRLCRASATCCRS